MTTSSWKMLFREIIAVYSENHMKPINTLCGQNEELLVVKAGGAYNYHWFLKHRSKSVPAVGRKAPNDELPPSYHIWERRVGLNIELNLHLSRDRALTKQKFRNSACTTQPHTRAHKHTWF
jgi:hypothetical protein